jgi:GxxExxY protein
MKKYKEGKDFASNYKYKDLTHEIINASLEVHNTLGCGFLEKVYENSLVYELKLRDIKVEKQREIEVSYKNCLVGNYICDLLVEDKIVIELKTVDKISNIHKAQILNYLKATKHEVGLLINFANPKLEFKRFAMSNNLTK